MQDEEHEEIEIEENKESDEVKKYGTKEVSTIDADISGATEGGAVQDQVQSNPNSPKTVCPSNLGINYSVNRKNTEQITDDEISLIISNKPSNDINSKLFVDNTFEKEVLLTKTNDQLIKSRILTSWWVSLTELTEREFKITFKIDECENIEKNITVIYSLVGGTD
jgi:hypothetical protein